MQLTIRAPAALLLLVVLVDGARAQPPAGGPAARQPADAAPTSVGQIDIRHPNYFVHVFEDTNKQERRNIHTTNWPADCSLQGNTQPLYASAVDAEVDYRSRLTIEFDRTFMRCNALLFEGAITVSGKIQGVGGTRDINIPGYWQAGQTAPNVSVVLRPAATAESGLANEVARLVEALDRETTLAIDAALGDASEISDDEVQALDSASDLALGGTADWMRSLDTLGYVDKVNLGNVLRPTVSWAVGNQRAMTELLRRVLSPETRGVVEGIAFIQGRDVGVFLQMATDAVDHWVPEMVEFAQIANPGPAEQRAQYQRVVNLVELFDLFYLRALVPDVSERCRDDYYAGSRAACSPQDAPELDRVDREFERIQDYNMAKLKDTSVLIPVEGAVPGDTLTLKFVNGATQATERDLVVQVRVGEFGVKREITDSALFIKRDVTPADLSGLGGTTATSIATEDESNYSPAPGVTLAWTFLPRPEKRAWQLLQPGLGLNVSFPQFDSTVATFTPASGTTPASTTFTQTDSDIDVAVGFTFSLFRNRLQLSWGKVLTVDQDRDYFAVGFSFVNLIRRPNNTDQK